jgi:hypothetical protein
LYLGGVKFADRDDVSDQMTASKVTAAVFIFNNLLSFSSVANFLQEKFDKYGHALFLNSCEKFRTVASAARGEEQLALWLLQGIDVLQEREHVPYELPMAELVTRKNSQPGLLDLMLYKKAVVQFAFGWAAQPGDDKSPAYSQQNLEKFTKVFQNYVSHDTFYKSKGDTSGVLLLGIFVGPSYE